MFLDLSPYRNKKIAVALSGGADSVALADYLFRFRKDFSLTLCAVNCEHGIRGEESVRDSLFVKEFCLERDIPLYAFSCDCVALAKQEKIGLEEAGRQFRYECFERVLQEGKADLIATAHHLNDNAETILFRLCRGTSLSGLKAISREGYIRPMLGVKKEEILNYIEQRGLSYCEDSTNDDLAYTRNAVRKTILPLLESEISGSAKNLCEFALSASEDDDFLCELSKEYLREENGKYFISRCKKPLFTRAAKSALYELGVKKDYEKIHFLSLYSLWEKENSARVSLPNGVEAEREGEEICLYAKEEKALCELPFAEGEFLFGNKTIVIGREEKGLRLDKNKLPEGCVIRTRREGDFLVKFGGGTRSLKKYFNDKKIPLRERDNLPLVAKGSEIFCAVGVDVSESVKTDENSDVLYLYIKHEGE